MLPLPTRAVPTSSTTSTPTVGSASITGSNSPRTRPIAALVSRSSRAAAAKRSVSCASRPSVLTTSAPSKLSCAIPLTCPRRCCARVISGDIRRL